MCLFIYCGKLTVTVRLQGELLSHTVTYLCSFLLYCHRIQKELADITLDPPPNCRLVSIPYLRRVGEGEGLKCAGVL